MKVSANEGYQLTKGADEGISQRRVSADEGYQLTKETDEGY
jgi:hypothetical protein